jgi:hypothetical protein
VFMASPPSRAGEVVPVNAADVVDGLPPHAPAPTVSSRHRDPEAAISATRNNANTVHVAAVWIQLIAK